MAATGKNESRLGRAAVLAAAVAAVMAGAPAMAQTSVVSACAGVVLPKSVVTDIVGAAVLPITGLLDPVLGILLNPLGLSSNLTSTLTSIASGNPVQLNVLDANGNVVSTADCPTGASSYELTNPKGISIGGNKITGLGAAGDANVADAGEIDSIAFGNRAKTDATSAKSIAIGPDATVGPNAPGAIALGSGASATAPNSVALGANSIADQPNTVSVGSVGNERRITNVAAGTNDTDAANMAQVNAVDARSVKYDVDGNGAVLKESITLSGVGGTKITNVKNGDVSATSTDAVNGSQLYAATSGLASTDKMNELGLTMAENLGGGAVYNSGTGKVSAPTYVVYGGSYNNVGAAVTALQTGAPVQYSNAAGVATPGTPSNDVTLVGKDPGPVALHNVATPQSDTDAANKAYVDSTVSQGIADANAVTYDSGAKDKITLAGAQSTDGGRTGGTKITNVQRGDVSANSTDAVNGSQLHETNQRIDGIENGGGIKYFHTNSTKADSQATGTDAVAAGPAAVSSGKGSVAVGDNSQATNDGAVAIGQDSSSSGVDSVAIGKGAVAKNSVAVGSGAQADNGGAAFGDNAIANGPNKGTAVGNGAEVTGANSVALGAGSKATRANTVSVGSAGNERQITNVADGTEPTDAVNKRQLDAAVAGYNTNIDARINGLHTDIDNVRKDAMAGAASAMAMASMPQAAFAGKSMASAAIANFKGESALAVGVSSLSDNGRWVAKLNGSANSRGDFGIGVGIGMHW